MANTTPAPTPSDAGATLVELLVSLAVLSMLSLMLIAGVGGRGAAWTRLDRDTGREEAVEAAQAILRARIAGAWPETTYDYMQPRPDFAGEAARLEFLAPAAPNDEPGAIRRYQLGVDAAGELVLQSRSELALDRTRWPERRVLMRGVQALDLGYFGADAPGRTPGWRAGWTRRPALPALVRVRLSFPEGDRRRWPDLLVRPDADTDTACVASATSGCATR